jgi:RNA polymerase sigma-70 factor (ECF subfamily)
MNQDDYLPTRHSLIQRLKNLEDQASWQNFFDTYWKFIYGVALKAGLSDAEAQDVVQETIITVSKKIKDFQVGSERGSFKAWLTHTTRWRIADLLRQRGLISPPMERSCEDTARTSTVERVPDPASLAVDESWERDWEQNLLEVALEKVKHKLDSQTFQIFYLHMIKQWPATKVASTVGAKLPQVYFAKYKVSRLLKRELERLKKDLI